jgi:hypothetical protein
VFDLSESRFPSGFENGGNTKPGILLDPYVEIFEAPGQLASQKLPHSGFAAAHESRQAHQRRIGTLSCHDVELW